MLQNFDSETTEVSVKINGIDEVPEKQKVFADSYITNAALLIQGVLNGQLTWDDLLAEQQWLKGIINIEDLEDE